MSNGKGSKPRPKSVDADTFASNWDAVFGQKLCGDCIVWGTGDPNCSSDECKDWRANHFGDGPDDEEEAIAVAENLMDGLLNRDQQIDEAVLLETPRRL